MFETDITQNHRFAITQIGDHGPQWYDLVISEVLTLQFDNFRDSRTAAEHAGAGRWQGILFTCSDHGQTVVSKGAMSKTVRRVYSGLSKFYWCDRL